MLKYYLVLSIFAILSYVAIYLFKDKDKQSSLTYKILAAVIMVAFFFRYELGKENISDILFLTVEKGFASKGQIVISAVAVWLFRAAEVFIFIHPFFRKKFSNVVVATFGLFATVLNIVLFKDVLLAVVGEGAFTGVTAGNAIRAILLAAEIGVAFTYSLSTLIFNVSDVKNMVKKDWIWFAVAVFGMIFATVPPYTLQLFFNSIGFKPVPKDFSLYHRLYIYPIAVFPVIIYFLLHKHSYDTKRFALIFYAVAQMINFSHSLRFADFAGNGWVTCLPLHLCNTAMFITPLCLIFKWNKLFYFTYFINVLGAFCAITMPNVSSGVLSTSAFNFFLSHYQAFYMPLLAVGLGVFPRPRWKEFKYSLVGFTVYFVLVLVINAWFTNYNPDVNYFFLNDGFIAEKLGTWAENLRNNVWQFAIGNLHFVLYPLYQFLFWLVYFAATFGMWFIYELAYDVIKGWQDIAARKAKIKVDALALSVALDGRSEKEPINMDGTNKLVLKNFTKRYSTSDVYAVKDANLEVCGGDVFGFLGPNGAGKSTIIKSIVGIQTITEGNIEVCGYDVATQPVMAKKQIGFVPDHYALYERLTAREYINYIADLYNVSKEDRDERLNRYIKLFEFETAIDNPIKTYSHGMKQKVTIMSALIHNPKVWILDEPLTGLDPNSIFQVKECMKQHAAEGNIVFFSSHIIDVVERICNKIAIIKKGQIQCVRNLAEMEESGENLEQFYMEIINDTKVEAIAVNPVKAK